MKNSIIAMDHYLVTTLTTVITLHAAAIVITYMKQIVNSAITIPIEITIATEIALHVDETMTKTMTTITDAQSLTIHQATARIVVETTMTLTTVMVIMDVIARQ